MTSPANGALAPTADEASGAVERASSEPTSPDQVTPRRAAAWSAGGQASKGALAALVAWAITVAPAAFSRSSPGVAGVTAVLALAAGITGPLLAGSRRRQGRHVGVTLFLGLAVVTWLLGSAAIAPARLDFARAALGGVAWGVYALSWSDRWGRGPEVVPDPSLPVLAARATLPAFAVPIATFGVLAGLAAVALAWRVRVPERAVVAHGAAIGCAVALVGASATVAISRSKPGSVRARRLTPAAMRALGLLTISVLVGGVVLALR